MRLRRDCSSEMQGRAMGGLPVGLLELYDPDSILLSADEIQAEDSNVARICKHFGSHPLCFFFFLFSELRHGR